MSHNGMDDRVAKGLVLPRRMHIATVLCAVAFELTLEGCLAFGQIDASSHKFVDKKFQACSSDTVTVVVASEFLTGLTPSGLFPRKPGLFIPINNREEFDTSVIMYLPLSRLHASADIYESFVQCGLDSVRIHTEKYWDDNHHEVDSLISLFDRISSDMIIRRRCVLMNPRCEADAWVLYKIFSIRMVVRYLGKLWMHPRECGIIDGYIVNSEMRKADFFYIERLISISPT